ncbi:putative nuclease HARBI1 [Ischnura elegans]|uniref:putative nuclease HARBI1 n=1 Tax=Ischnura elegans TaxID=197161 RepID=UPI001ED88846|nr:putative nuclease HARBI1 [Ischnura elegans]
MLAVMEGLFRSVVTLPTHQELEGIGLDFAAKAGSDTFSKCVGVIDGSHVRVFSPRGMNEAYINRKLFYSLQMQVLCIGSGKINDFYAGFPGSVHDARVLRHSSLYANAHYPPEGYFIIGDGGYPCRLRPIYLMVPFRAPQNRLETLFNHKLSKARIVVERVFGIMKTRWRCIFTKTLELRVAQAVKVITSCAVMHNICITAGDVLLDHDNMQQRNGLKVVEGDVHGEGFRERLVASL